MELILVHVWFVVFKDLLAIVMQRQWTMRGLTTLLRASDDGNKDMKNNELSVIHTVESIRNIVLT